MSTITVGNQEKHEVSFIYDTLWAKDVTMFVMTWLIIKNSPNAI